MTVLDRLELVLKHMPGKHDQKLHAGTRAISNSGVAPKDTSEDSAAIGYFRNGVKWRQNVDSPADGEDVRLKIAVATQLAEDTGLDKSRISQLIRSWAESSNDNNATSLGMQKAASEELGVELSDFQKQRIEYVTTSEGPVWGAYGANFPLDRRVREYNSAREDGRKIVRAMYDRTQKELADAGIDKVKVFRGMKLEGAPTVVAGDKLQTRGNAMESWSLQQDVAQSFATNRFVEREHGLVVSSELPASRVLCTAKTGYGCLFEYETVITGNKPNQVDEVSVVNVAYQ